MEKRKRWADAAARQRVRELHADGLGAKMIADRIGVSRGAVAGLINRLNLCREEVAAPKIADFWQGSVAPAWGTPEARELFKALWIGNIRVVEIQEFFNITTEARRHARDRFGLAPRDPATSTKKRGRRDCGKPTVPPPPIPPAPPQHRPLGSANGGKTPHYLGSSASINWRVVNEMKIEHAPGRCRWPLTCAGETNGNFCQHHSGLLGRRAT